MLGWMDVTTPERSWLWSVLLRAVVWGFAAASLSLAGVAHVAGRTAGGGITSVLLSTILLAIGVGAWAGAPEADAERVKLRERWLSAAALAAVGASFAAFSQVYEQLYPAFPWGIGDVLLTVALPAYGIGLLVPALVAWSERASSGAFEAEARPWGVAGPLAGGALLGGICGVLLAGLFLLPTLGAGSLLMTTAVLLLAPLLVSDPARAAPRESSLFERTTPFGSVRVTEVVARGERQPERRLYLNDEEESAELVRTGTPTLGYIAAAEHWLSAVTPPGASYLFLGGGAYTLPRRIAERDSSARIDVVELDPEITRIAHHFFGLSPHHRIRSIHGDARAFLSKGGEPVDRIYVDVYGGSEKLPFSLVTREAAELMADRLRPDGILAMNVIGKVMDEERRQLWSVVRTFAEAFPNVALYTHLGRDFPDRQNLLLVATRDEARSFPAAAGHFESWPRSEWPPLDEAVVFRDIVTGDAGVGSSQFAPAPPGSARELPRREARA
jgi:hypothetical protein